MPLKRTATKKLTKPESKTENSQENQVDPPKQEKKDKSQEPHSMADVSDKSVREQAEKVKGTAEVKPESPVESEKGASEESKGEKSSGEEDDPTKKTKNVEEMKSKSAKGEGKDKAQEPKSGTGATKRRLDPMTDIGETTQQSKRHEKDKDVEMSMAATSSRRFIPASAITHYEDFHKNNLLYVDKTEQLYNMLTTHNPLWQLARPRRFGKTLMLNTIKCIFQGKKELFDECWIYNAPSPFWETIKRKVLYITMPPVKTGSDVSSYDKLVRYDILRYIEEDLGIVIKDDKEIPILHYVIAEIHKIIKAPIALLIDEYDRPFIEQAGQPREKQDAFKNYMKDLYAPIKDFVNSGCISFALLAGISSVALGDNSASNSFKNITLEKDYSEIVGITEDEIQTHVEIQGIMERIIAKKETDYETEMKKIKDYYNGFQFHPQGKKLINTNAFMRYLENDGDIRPYFAMTKTTLMHDCLNFTIPQLQQLLVGDITCSPELLEASDNTPIPFLFFSGYLTILSDAGNGTWRLKFTNNEVKTDYMKYWIKARNVSIGNLGLTTLAEDEKYEEYIHVLNANLGKIPAGLTNECEFQAIMYAIYLLDNAKGLHLELRTTGGILDMKTEDGKFVNIIEYKFNKTARMAMDQIMDNKYYRKYLKIAEKSKKLIRLFGINYRPSTKEMSGMIVWKQRKPNVEEFGEVFNHDKPLQLANFYITLISFLA
eukprot:TRINITY_DN2864_c0_g2_i1.p1 TRINITY_DN2864_c0_g2~~TRINITY_DN2864_c0_g2_i1.p1  ORF type:complete len:715 (+),score=75.39 TRINITY_DN2864_c0_g2_i1:273-2417(+)